MPTSATAVPTGFTDTLVASVGSPTALAFTPGGQLLVTTQLGDVRVVQNGTLLPAPALDLGAVLCTASEQGLLGVAVDPSFASNGFVYLYYTRNKSGTCVNRVSRFTMSGSTISMASELGPRGRDPLARRQPQRRRPPLRQRRLSLHQRRRRRLRLRRRQRLRRSERRSSRDQHVLVGKILRITSTGGIPPSNPFQGAGTARCNVTGRTTAGNKCQETFAWGLRNPFRIAFDPNTTATRFFINDVGQGAWEEVDLGVAGADYGWNVREGPCVNGSLTNCGAPPAGMTNPVYSYSHPRVRLRRDHRRRLRAERGLAVRLRRHLSLRGLHLRQDLRAHAERQRRLHAERVHERRRRRRQHDVRAVTARAGALLHELLGRRRGAAAPVDRPRQPAADGSHDSVAHLRSGPAGRELRRQREHRSRCGRHAHVHLELRRRLAASDDELCDDEPHVHDRGHLHRDADGAGQRRRPVVPVVSAPSMPATRPRR